jgi:hypothetical protein
VAGRPGEGAVFRLTLPREQDTAISAEPEPVPFAAEHDVQVPDVVVETVGAGAEETT